MIKKSVFCLTAILILLLTLFACGQQDIFYTIKEETAPKKPRVDGAPSNMVVFNRTAINPTGPAAPVMYVASGKNLYWYAKDLSATSAPYYKWNLYTYDTPKLPGKIRSLAATNTYLYALCDPGLFRITTNSTTWEAIGSDASGKYPTLQNIFADSSGQLFAGANNGGTYGILYLDASNKLQVLADNTELLSGVANNGTTHFLSTRGKGVYTFSGTPSTTTILTQIEAKNLLIAGMIQLNATTVIAIERDGGTLYKVATGGLTHAGASASVVKTGKYATGALALYNKNSKDYLIVGVQGVLFNTTSSYSHGYKEFEIDAGDLKGPNEPTVTVVSGNQYTSSIGKRPINFMLQPPATLDNTEMLFFASTQTTGLWSFRFRDGVWQWNAED